MLAMIACSVAFVSCSDDDDDDSENSSKNIVGTWVENYQYSSSETLITTFTFKANGSGTMTERLEYSDGSGLTSDPVSFSYAYDGTSTIQLKFADNNTLYTGTATITGNTLILTFGGTYYTLIKS